MNKRHLVLIPLILAAITVVGYQSVFTVPKQDQLSFISTSGVELSLECYKNSQAKLLDHEKHINLLVWNIYKQNRENWEEELTKFSSGAQLVLLQEVSMTSDFQYWIQQQKWFGNQVDAFEAFDATAGVLNLSIDTPSAACAYTELEPWLRLPKSALYATYPLSDGTKLAVVNIHAVNFTYGTEEYHRQLNTLVEALLNHKGPVIVAGDFNSWSEARLKVMSQALQRVGLKEVSYDIDNRKQFITGLPLDHVFYRGLELIKAEAPISSASDHNPILVSFKLNL